MAELLTSVCDSSRVFPQSETINCFAIMVKCRVPCFFTTKVHASSGIYFRKILASDFVVQERDKEWKAYSEANWYASENLSSLVGSLLSIANMGA